MLTVHENHKSNLSQEKLFFLICGKTYYATDIMTKSLRIIYTGTFYVLS